MFGNLAKIFHQKTNLKFEPGKDPSDPTTWPKEWIEIIYKIYPRFPKIELSKNLLEIGDLKKVLFKRKSERNFDTEKEISFEELSTLVYYSAGIKEKNENPNLWRRFYPSGGARYPLEVYLVVQRVKNLEKGVFHYNVKDNLLEKILNETALPEFLSFLSYPWSRNAALFFLISAHWDRNFIKYKDFGYRLVLLEAGHMMQNLLLIASSLEIKACPLAGFNTKIINEILDIDKEGEDIIYLASLGR